MRPLSIRLRLTLWYSAVLVAGMVLFGGALRLGLERRLTRQLDERLAQRIEGVRTVFELEAPLPAEELRKELSEFLEEVQDGIRVEVRDTRGRAVLSSSARRGKGAYRVVSRIVQAPGGPYSVMAAVPLDTVRGLLRTLDSLFLALMPAVFAAACLGGYWISGRALRPVDRITEVARTIGIRNLSRRLDVPRTGDELQRMSEAWNDVLARLESAVRRIRQFTADASHELRTPVALIRATAELALRRERSTEEYRESLREIHTEAERMTALTESLLLLARADSESLDMPMKPVDLNSLAAEVVRQSEPLAGAKGVRLRATAAAQRKLAKGNDAALRRLLLILIDNALKYTPAGGQITVDAGGGALCVRDTGDGISPDALPHIFERFYRADASRTGDGAGLGLSIAQAIAHAHGTEIEVESAPGEGACFRVKLAAS